jgi:hypothetical protein
VDESSFANHVESGVSAWNVDAARMLGRLLVCVVLNNDGIERLTGFIDKMNTISSHRGIRIHWGKYDKWYVTPRFRCDGADSEAVTTIT